MDIGFATRIDQSHGARNPLCGNQGTRLWRQHENSQVNIFENGILKEFQAAPENLRIFRLANPLYEPWTSRFDINLAKCAKITDRFNLELRAQFLNAFNQSAITIRGAGTDSSSITVGSTATFGQTTNAFRDFTVSGTNDPGGRLIDFQLCLNF